MSLFKSNDSVPVVSRRRMLAGSGAAVGGLLVAATPLTSANAVTPTASNAVPFITRIARIGAVFPIEFPSFGESGSALDRATAARARKALKRCGSSRTKEVLRGAEILHDRGFAVGKSDAALLDLLADVGADPEAAPSVTALIAVAVTTLVSSFDPERDRDAAIWLDGLVAGRRLGALRAVGASR